MKKRPQSRRPAKKRPLRHATRVKRLLAVNPEEFSRLQESLREAQETLDAIRHGEVDAVVVSGERGEQIYSLAGAEQPYRVFVEQMEEGAVTVSADAIVLYCNRRFAEMVGLPLEKVISADVRTFIVPEAWKAIAGVFTSEGAAVKHEALLCRVGSEGLPVSLAASHLPVENRPTLCLVVTDMTSHRERETFRLGKEVAERASAAKDSFLAALSHELRTPLTPALMVAGALENDATLSEKVRADLGVVRRNIELEARLIDDLLDLTRISNGKLELQYGEINVHLILNRAIEICEPDALAKRQQIRPKLSARHTAMEGDAVRLQQVFWNVIRNAVKFTPPEGTIAIHTASNSAGNITICVEDSGIGFEPGSARNFFRAFEQGGRHITRQFGGLGLGLAISRSIVEAHGGRVRAESPGFGRGATFVIELPLGRRNRRREDPKAEAKSDTTNGPGRSLRILLVEDHKDTRASIQKLLQHARHDVMPAASAREALESAAANRFDLVISDLGLPDQSGHQLMRQLRQQFGLPGIALSGYGMEDDVAQSREAGFAHHLTKPINIDRLKELLVEFNRD
jgi:PAS domain S-box-containing protein